MKATFNIEGMQCIKCADKVKKVLEAIPGINKADVSLEKNTVTLDFSVPSVEMIKPAIKAAVSAAGFKVKD